MDTNTLELVRIAPLDYRVLQYLKKSLYLYLHELQLQHTGITAYVNCERSTNERILVEVYENFHWNLVDRRNWSPMPGPPLSSIHKFSDVTSKFGALSKNAIEICPGFVWDGPWKMDTSYG